MSDVAASVVGVSDKASSRTVCRDEGAFDNEPRQGEAAGCVRKASDERVDRFQPGEATRLLQKFRIHAANAANTRLWCAARFLLTDGYGWSPRRRQRDIFSSCNPLVFGPNAPIVTTTMAIDPAISANTPVTPKSLRKNAIMKPENMALTRLAE